MITSDDLALLFVKERNRLLGFARKLCAGNSTEADDLISEAFVQILRRRETFQEDCPLLPWVSKIMVNKQIDSYRRNRRARQTVSIERLGPTLEMICAMPVEDQDMLVVEERKAALKLAIGQLPKKLREICELIYFQGLKYEVAATKLGIPLGTVKSRMNAAIKRLSKSAPLRPIAWRHKDSARHAA